jgi:polyphosphate kinase 2 (PPK2 family)
MRRKRSGFDKYKEEIEKILATGITKRSAWKIISSMMKEHERLSYQAFLHFLKRL